MFASSSLSGNFPVTMLLFMRTAILVDNKSGTDFIILGPIPSYPVALPESNAKTLIRILDKMNNSRPIIKTFYFPKQNAPNVFFLPILPTFFYFCQHTKMLDTPKWFSDCESVNSVVSINISRGYYSGAKTGKKNFQKD